MKMLKPAALSCPPDGVVMEIACPQNFGGMKSVLVSKEALCRFSGRHAYGLEPEDPLWLDDLVGSSDPSI